MAKPYNGRSEAERDFIKIFNQLVYRRNPWTAWRDFVTLSACSISNAVDRTPSRWGTREDLYLSAIKGYTQEEAELFPQLLATTAMALETNPAQDFLGCLYMNLDFGSGWSGQFFTPWNVSEMMARMTIGNIADEIKEKGFVSVLDCACGAGCILLAHAYACRQLQPPVNYQQSVLYVGQDLDPVVARMCYIQLSLMGCAGYVVTGDSLAHPARGSLLHPVVDEGCELWFTPMWYSEAWTFRQISDSLARLFGGNG